MHTYEVEMIKHALHFVIHERELESLRVEPAVYIDDLARQLVGQLEVWSAVDGVDRVDVEEQWPADWWQAFKDRWFPVWAKKQWPIQYHTETMTARELYPQVVLSPDRYEAVIAVDKSGQW